MAEGRVIADGEPNSIYENQVVIDAYLGTRKASK
jgi:ABC-type branched-subunit amino acid transport system ATPase component